MIAVTPPWGLQGQGFEKSNESKGSYKNKKLLEEGIKGTKKECRMR